VDIFEQKTEKQMNKEEEQFLLKLVKKHIPKCEKHLEFLNDAIDIYDNAESLSNSLNADLNIGDNISVLQFNFLLTNSELELNLIFKNLVTSEYKWEKIYFIKLACLNIYETLNSYYKHKKTIKDISDTLPDLSTTFINVNKDVGKFANDFSVQTKINKVRNKTIGHFENDIKEYFKIVLDLDYDDSVKMIYAFMELLQSLHDFSLNCLISTGPQIPEEFDVEKNYEEMKNKLLQQKEILKKNIH